MENYSSQIEFLPNSSFGSLPDFNQRPWFHAPRFIIFGVVFLICSTAGLIYTYSRPAIYRSSATLLTSAMTAIDRESDVADIQNVAIQKQVLLGYDVVAETLLRLKASTANGSIVQLTVPDIMNLLDVVPVAETNLLEIQAEGPDSGFLPLLINSWIDAYLDVRAKEVKNLTDNTTSGIEEELKGLADKINTARTELEAFRRNNDILSTGRDENEVLARLKGLSDSLNHASEDEVRAKANLEAIKTAIANNKTVVPNQDQGSLQDLEKRLQQLREKLTELDNRFTRDYLNLQPKLKVIPEQIKKLEAEIKDKRQYGKNIVLTEAEENYAAAQQTVKDIRTQLNEHKEQTAKFTSKFAEHETLKTDLEGLEKLYRETKERLIQIETGHKEKYPQVTVIKQAYLFPDPVRPNYSRDAIIAIAGSLLSGLFAIWISEYLTRKQGRQPPMMFSGIHMYTPAAEMINYQQTAIKPIEQQPNKALDCPPVYAELSNSQLRALLNAATLKGKQLIGLLLSGLTIEEAASLKADQIDLSMTTITVTDPMLRTITINRSLKALFEQSGGYPVWIADKQGSTESLTAALLCAAIDSGLPHSMEITADAIRHSYIIYLVRQGLRLADLEQIVGYLQPHVILAYSSYSPAQKGCGVDDIELLHPALADL